MITYSTLKNVLKNSYCDSRTLQFASFLMTESNGFSVTHTCIVSNIIVWVKAANVMCFYHMLVPYFPVVWIMQYIIYLMRTYFSKCGVNLKYTTSISSNYNQMVY